MIAEALRLEIERYAVRMRRTNPLYFRAALGDLTAEHLARYLKAIHCLVSHTPIHLRRAAELAAERGDAALAAHYRGKLDEEAGHDEWAERDLAAVSSRRPSREVPVHGEMMALIGYIERVIDGDPTLYLAYILFAEYLTVLLGAEWLDLLETRCGIPRSSMSVIGNHAELDREHVADAFIAIDALVEDPRKLSAMRDVLTATVKRYEAFCGGIMEDADAALRAIPARAPAA